MTINWWALRTSLWMIVVTLFAAGLFVNSYEQKAGQVAQSQLNILQTNIQRGCLRSNIRIAANNSNVVNMNRLRNSLTQTLGLLEVVTAKAGSKNALSNSFSQSVYGILADTQNITFVPQQSTTNCSAVYFK